MEGGNPPSIPTDLIDQADRETTAKYIAALVLELAKLASTKGMGKLSESLYASAIQAKAEFIQR